MNRILRTLASAALALSAVHAQADTVFGANGYRWDIDNLSGMIQDGTNDAYDGGYMLVINGQTFTAPYSVSADRRTHYFAGELAGLRVTRKVYVPTGSRVAGADYLRYVDCVENTSAQTVPGVELRLQTNLGSDGGTTTWALPAHLTHVIGTDDGDGSGDPSLAHLYGSGTQSMVLGGDFLTWSFTTPTVRPGRKLCYRTYAVQADNQAAAAALASSLSQNPDVDGMTAVEQKTLQNDGSIYTARLDVFPPKGAVMAAGTSFDVSAIVTAPAEVLAAYTLTAQLNQVDVSASCRASDNLVNAQGEVTGQVVRCAGLSSRLLNGSNAMVFRLTSGKTTAKAHATWQVLPVQSSAR